MTPGGGASSWPGAAGRFKVTEPAIGAGGTEPFKDAADESASALGSALLLKVSEGAIASGVDTRAETPRADLAVSVGDPAGVIAGSVSSLDVHRLVYRPLAWWAWLVDRALLNENLHAKADKSCCPLECVRLFLWEILLDYAE